MLSLLHYNAIFEILMNFRAEPMEDRLNSINSITQCQGFDINWKPFQSTSDSIIRVAFLNEEKEIIDKLLNDHIQELDVNEQSNQDGTTLLHLLCSQYIFTPDYIMCTIDDRKKWISLLLDHDADPNITNIMGSMCYTQPECNKKLSTFIKHYNTNNSKKVHVKRAKGYRN